MCRVFDFVHRKRCIAERFRKACRCCVRRPEFLILQAQGERPGCRRSMSRKIQFGHCTLNPYINGESIRVSEGKQKDAVRNLRADTRKRQKFLSCFGCRKRPQLFKIITVGNAFGGFDYIRSAVTCTDLLQFIFGKCGNAFRSREKQKLRCLN